MQIIQIWSSFHVSCNVLFSDIDDCDTSVINIPEGLGEWTDSGLCLNGGTCIDKVDDYKCNCSIGYEGRNCLSGKQR